METVPFIIASKKMKYVRKFERKKYKACTLNYKILLKGSKRILRKWRDSPYTWVERLNILKIQTINTVLTKDS